MQHEPTTVPRLHRTQVALPFPTRKLRFRGVLDSRLLGFGAWSNWSVLGLGVLIAGANHRREQEKRGCDPLDVGG